MVGQFVSTYSADIKIHLILDALLGEASSISSSNISIYRLVNVLKLLVQEPLVFTFTDEHGRLLYSSNRQSGYTFTQQKDNPPGYISFKLSSGQKLSLYIYVEPGFNSSCDQKLADTEVANQYKHLFRLVEANHDLCKTFENAFFNLKSYEDISFHDPASPLAVTGREEYNRLIAPVRTVIDEALGDMGDAPLLSRSPDKSRRDLPYPNIFFIVQNAALDQHHTSKLLLSVRQISLIDIWAKSVPDACVHPHKNTYTCFVNGGETVAEQIESMPLFNADAAFESGSVEFLSGTNVPGTCTQNKTQIQSIENCICSQLGLEKPMIMLIPIHIAGVPWITLYTVTSLDHDAAEGAWIHNYHFYHSISRTIANGLQSGLYRLYLDLVAAELEKEDVFFQGELATELINQRWCKLATVYPFEQVSINLAEESNEAAIVGSSYSSKKYALKQVPNQWYRRQTHYSLQLEDLKLRCEAALLKADEKVDVVNRKFTEHIMQQAHTVKNMLCPVTTNLDSAVEFLSSSRYDHSYQKLTDSRHSVDILLATLQILLSPHHGTPEELRDVSTIEDLIHWLISRNLSCHPHIEFTNLNNKPLRLLNLPASFTALWNLLHNAVNYSKDDTVPVRITLSRNDANETVLSISNDGEMPPHASDILCGMIQITGDDAYRGLPITARKIVEAGWQVLDVIVGVGTTIRINLNGGLLDENTFD